MAIEPAAALRKLLSDVDADGLDSNRARFSGADDLYGSLFQAGAATGVALAAAGLALHDEPWVDIDLAAASLASEGYRHVRLDGESVAAPRDALTGFYDTLDGGQIFLHVNFPHHRDRALAVLDAQPTRESLAARIGAWPREALDEALARAGAIAAPALSFAEWDASDQGRHVRSLPLVEIEQIGDSAPEPAHLQDEGVVDVTRVLAGPTCCRVLAEAGAQVTRVDHPTLADLIAYRLDANRDKQEIALDFREPLDRARILEMAARAHVFVQAYRPGALAQFGFEPERLAAARPGLICASLSAYGRSGSWAERRGFDSVVQAACGLATAEGAGAPRLLPTSPLDYCAGFLLAFGVGVALRRRAAEGGSYHVQVSLARVALWLRDFQHDAPPAEDAARRAAAADAQSTETATRFGLVRHLRSPMIVSG